MTVRLPWSDTCFVCGDSNPSGLGGRFVIEEGDVVLRTTPPSWLEGYQGQLHGGVVTALLDETIGWACTVAHGRFCVTAELSIRFLRPVRGGQQVVARGRAGEVQADRVTGHGELLDARGRRLAAAEGVFVPVSPARHARVIEMLTIDGRPATADDLPMVESAARRDDGPKQND
jgi:uncharacterized protein (TIGR00369 family)